MEVVAAGIDTWTLNWRIPEDSAAAKLAAEIATVPQRRGAMLPEPVRGHRVIYEPGFNLVRAEGHPSGDKAELCAVADLERAAEELQDELDAIGLELPRQIGAFLTSSNQRLGVSRLDSTVNLVTDGRAHGLSLLSGVAAAEPSMWFEPVTRREAGGTGLKQVHWTGQRGIVARVYDKGLESMSAPRGELLRFEGQTRWPGASRRDLEELTPAYVRDVFRKRFTPLWRATEGVKIVTKERAAKRIVEAVADERITATQAVQAAGHLLLTQAGHRVGSRSTQWRRRKLVGELGLVLGEDGQADDREIDLCGVMEQVVDTEAWERRG